MGFGIQTFDEKGNLLFTSERRIAKLQGWRIIKGWGAQSIKLKQGQYPFFIAVPYSKVVASNRMLELKFDHPSSSVYFHSINNNEYILYYGTY